MRKRKPKARIVAPDPRFNDIMVTQFVNNMMLDGKKSTAEKIIYSAMDIISSRGEKNGIETFNEAISPSNGNLAL